MCVGILFKKKNNVINLKGKVTLVDSPQQKTHIVQTSYVVGSNS